MTASSHLTLMITTTFSLHSPRLLDILLSLFILFGAICPPVLHKSCMGRQLPLPESQLYKITQASEHDFFSYSLGFWVYWNDFMTTLTAKILFSLCYEGMKLKGWALVSWRSNADEIDFSMDIAMKVKRGDFFWMGLGGNHPRWHDAWLHEAF